jgi:hypothetical protein
MTCRWDRDAEEYLNDGEPCRTDDYGDPTRHCQARRSCAQHVGEGEITCARCLGRTRTDVRRIVALSPLMVIQALGSGVDSEAANLAGPAADYRVFSARRLIAKAWIVEHIHQPARDWCEDPDCQLRHFKANGGDRWHKRGIENALTDLLDDDDEYHPYSVLTRWQMMLSEDYGSPLPDHLSIASAGDYLDRTLHRMAQDPEQDFGLFAREMRQCRNHLEAVIRNSATPERGAPCPDCKDAGHVVRMSREYGHWCDDPLCERFHHADDSDDRWVCPRDRDHWRTHEDYCRWIEERTQVVGA